MLDLTPFEEAKLKALLAPTAADLEANLREQAEAIVSEAMTEANVEQFGRRVSEQLLPELEALFGGAETHLCTVEARLVQLEGRVKLLERICARLMPVGAARS
jgi:ABC-type phosphate transport system ATPase subunit